MEEHFWAFSDNLCGGAPYLVNATREIDATGSGNVTYTCDEGYYFQDTKETVKVVNCFCGKDWSSENLECIGEYRHLHLFYVFFLKNAIQLRPISRLSVKRI